MIELQGQVKEKTPKGVNIQIELCENLLLVLSTFVKYKK